MKSALAPKVIKTAKFVSMMIKAQFAAHSIKLTKEQFAVLLYLEEGRKNQSFLAVVTERDKGSLTRLIQSLEKKGYIKRTTSKEDNRVNQVELTTKGREILAETKPLMMGFFSSLQEGISAKEMELATKVLQKMQQNAINQIEKLEEKKK